MRPSTKSDTHPQRAQGESYLCPISPKAGRFDKTTQAYGHESYPQDSEGAKKNMVRQYDFCEPRQYAQNGEIVVALINNEEATVKRFFLRKDHIELRPENKAYPSMRYRFGEVLIQGKVIGVQRGPEQLS